MLLQSTLEGNRAAVIRFGGGAMIGQLPDRIDIRHIERKTLAFSRVSLLIRAWAHDPAERELRSESAIAFARDSGSEPCNMVHELLIDA